MFIVTGAVRSKSAELRPNMDISEIYTIKYVVIEYDNYVFSKTE